MFFIFVRSLVFRSIFLDKRSEHANLFIKMTCKVKAVLLAQTKLAEVVIETLL